VTDDKLSKVCSVYHTGLYGMYTIKQLVYNYHDLSNIGPVAWLQASITLHLLHMLTQYDTWKPDFVMLFKLHEVNHAPRTWQF